MWELECRQQVLDAFLALIDSIQKVSDAILSETHLAAWTQNSDSLLFKGASHLSAREKTARLLAQLHYLDDQEPREILLCAGFIGASKETLALAREVNACKAHFKHTMLAFKKAKGSPNDAWLKERCQPLQHAFSQMGLARLHLKQCYRTIPLLAYSPHKISWTWAHTRAIRRISRAQAEVLLQKKGEDPGIQRQLQKLASLSPHEPLAIVQELAPHLRANVVFKDAPIVRHMIKGPVPLFFPCTPETPVPHFVPPSPKCPRDETRPVRADVQLEPTPFLPAIHVHRYATRPS